MSNFKSQAKRKRELAKLDKRQAKEQKRALRRAERSPTDVATAQTAAATAAQPMTTGRSRTPSAAAVRTPPTLAEMVEQWRKTKVVKPTKR